MGQTAVIPAQIVDVAARSLLGNNTSSADAAQTISFSSASAGDVLTVQGDGSVAFAAVSAGIGGSTGSTDNAVLRADGTAGDTLQNSGWIIPDIYTASPNATVNHLSMQATGASTNVSVSIVPKGTGAFSLQVPDGTTAGGNARGANAVDLQTIRTQSDQVAGGNRSFVAGGLNSVSGTYGVAIGAQNIVTADNGFAVNYNTRVTAYNGSAFGLRSLSRLPCMRALASGQFAAAGDAQAVEICLRGKTTTDAPVTLLTDQYGDLATRLTIPAGKILYAMVHVLGSKSDGSAVASYMRQFCIKRVVNTTSLVGTVNTIGTDEAAGTSLAITADDTNDAADIAPTGVNGETWRWVAYVFGVELAFGN